ncbi:FAD-binding oxidoreductase [Paraburkholderia sediminicola]|uniref:FAD-binding oxidoreductase n=1 Tax=Paraburkholderia sediminicola TaxID=458836 RepID=UPI0038B97310
MTETTVERGQRSPGAVAARKDLSAYRTENPLLDQGIKPAGVIVPKDVLDLQAILADANARGTALVPVSSEGAHVKGGISCGENHAMLDLSGWKEILRVDRRNRVAMIEPGVTYAELSAALEPQGMMVSMPLAPRRGKSVIAAVLDREPTTWPNRQWDPMDPMASSEFLFGTGDLFRTGSGGGPGSLEVQRKVGGAQKSSQGPGQTDFVRVLSGAQGCMGIISWITIRTELKPSIEKPQLLGSDRLEKLIPFVYDVQRPWLGDHCLLLNRTAAAMLISAVRKVEYKSVRASLPSYLCLQNIAGFERLPRQRVIQQYADISEKAKLHGLKMDEGLGGLAARDLLDAARKDCGERDWRRDLQGHCLSTFFLTTLDRAPHFIQTIEALAGKHQIDPEALGVYVQPIVQNHGCHIEFMVPYDPTKPADVARIAAFESEAVKQLAAVGAYFSRPYGEAQNIVFQANPGNFEFVKTIKSLFDPNRILNPGKFGL